MGASGAGVTTLGRAVADALGTPHHDMDDYFWLPTVPPYREVRPAADRVRLMREMFLPRMDWVLSGALDGWGGEIAVYFDAAVFLATPTDVRLARLLEREIRRYGAAAVAPGGWRHMETGKFLEWAGHYDDDDGSCSGRSRERHETWLAGLSCSVLRVDGGRCVADLVAEVVAWLGQGGYKLPMQAGGRDE